MPSEGPLRDGGTPEIPEELGLIETLRWEPVTGFLRGERHLARLARSAGTLGLKHDPQAARAALEAAVGGDAPLRVRLELSPGGALDVTTQPFTPLPAGTVWRLAIAPKTRLSYKDPLLAHKTTRRDAYEAARAEVPKDEADEVLLLNESGELCEGSFTTLFMRRDGVWLTPALSCGLLAGVLREEMLEKGTAREARLTRSDLLQADKLAVGNSLRGLIPASID